MPHCWISICVFNNYWLNIMDTIKDKLQAKSMFPF